MANRTLKVRCIKKLKSLRYIRQTSIGLESIEVFGIYYITCDPDYLKDPKDKYPWFIKFRHGEEFLSKEEIREYFVVMEEGQDGK